MCLIPVLPFLVLWTRSTAQSVQGMSVSDLWHKGTVKTRQCGIALARNFVFDGGEQSTNLPISGSKFSLCVCVRVCMCVCASRFSWCVFSQFSVEPNWGGKVQISTEIIIGTVPLRQVIICPPSYSSALLDRRPSTPPPPFEAGHSAGYSSQCFAFMDDIRAFPCFVTLTERKCFEKSGAA